ncbi:aldehyde dehydrogenase [Paenibacillus silvae]|uniref:aldehyde dehydrogenase n=1 Tax=Paenibacillus silvae TaxID=1325358 RepID=UPI00119F7B12|nr:MULTISPECIES: aldehyde dehydrogenase [Paenibacillus]MCK6078235.1 aldehyde dehydrogenase [Paenibacillus silvae]MCK6152577.1 aldehyde dehydrogenase [Paenibacillus silvae]MCK6271028.1 aldehyde dehydrogenase [Paenibacillus silvae]
MTTLQELSSEDVQLILTRQQLFFRSGATRSAEVRIQRLTRLKQAIQKYETRLTKALYQDLGKSEFESYTTEIGFMLDSITHTIRKISKWMKPTKVKTQVALLGSKSFIIPEPYGAVLIIGPFNYPFQLLIEPLVGAIAAGNTAVLKASEHTPAVSAVVRELIGEVFEPEYVQVVEGAKDTTTALIHAPFDYIFFTGSVPVGKIVMQAAAQNLVPVTLELGGKSPVIVDEQADIQVAAERIIWGKLLNTGQTCIAPDYLLVHERVKQPLIEALKGAIAAFFETDIQNNKDYGRIVNHSHFKRLTTLIERDREKVIYGGASDEEHRFIEPTLIDALWDAATMEDEIFGPILPIISYSHLDEAIAQIVKRPKPLALYLFTSNKDVQDKVLTEVSFGGGCINDTITHVANPRLPFGGVGHSGIGSYHGRYSFETFSHMKSILKKSTRINPPVLYPPYDNKLKLIKRLLK